MRQFLFAAALAAVVASVGTAEEKTTAPTTAAAPVMIATAGTPVIESVPAQSGRRGLFGRLRNRNTSTVTYMPAAAMTPAMISAPAAPMAMPAAPMAMPAAKTTTAAMPMPIPPSGIIVAGGTTTDGTVMMAGNTEPMTAAPAMQSQPTRRGLFGRLRNR